MLLKVCTEVSFANLLSERLAKTLALIPQWRINNPG